MPDPEYEPPKIDWITALLPGTKKDDRNPDPGIKSLLNPVGSLKDPMKKYAN